MGLFGKKEKNTPQQSSTAVASESEKSSTRDPSIGAKETGGADDHVTEVAPTTPAPADETALEKRIEAISADEEAQEEDESHYPKAFKLFMITVAICLGVFCVALDNTIISTAIPRITDQFHAINDVGWYGSAYLLTTCAFQLFFGKLYTFFSIKWVYLIAIIIFEVGSAICGAAPNSPALIVGRAIAGLGSAGIFSGAILIIANTVPLRKRPAYTGLVGGMYGLASVAGPLMGGAFTDKVSWRWCFYINLPIGAVTLAFVFLFYNPTSSAQTLASSWKDQLEQLDIWGTLIFLPMIVCLLLALQWGGSQYPWSNGRIIALFVLFGVLLIVFIGIQFWKQDNGTVPPRVVKQRSVAAGALFSVCLGGSFFVFVYYLPIWFQAIKGVSAVQSGVDNIPMILGLVIFSLIAGAAVTQCGYYTPFVIASTILMSIGAGLLSTLNASTGHSKWIGYQVIFGAGIGFGMQQTLMAVQTVLPPQDVPIGTAIVMFAQLLGGALFISVAQNVFTNSLLKNVVSAVPGIDPQLVLSTGATDLASHIDPQYLPGVKVAYNGAIINTFYVAVAMACASAVGAGFLEWRSMKGKKIEMAAA